MFFSVSHSIKIFSYFKLHFYRDSLKRHWDWGLHIMHVINWISTLSVWWLQDIFFYLRSFAVHLYWKLILVMCRVQCCDKWHKGCLIVNFFFAGYQVFTTFFWIISVFYTSHRRKMESMLCVFQLVSFTWYDVCA